MAATRRRLLGAGLDQAVSSLQNFCLLLAALHWFSLDQLGVFSLAYACATLVLTVARSLVLEPLVILRVGHELRETSTRQAIGLSLVVGVGAGICWAAAAALFGGSTRLTVLATAVVLPVVLLQDAYRFGLFVRGEQLRAAVQDGAGLIVTVVVLALGWVSGTHTGWFVMGSWGLGCAAAALVGARQLGVGPDLGGARQWWAESRSLGGQLAGSTAAQQGVGRASQAMVSLIASPAALGLVSASRTVYLPMTTLLTASTTFALPESAQRLRSGGRSLTRFAVQVSLALSACVALSMVAILAVPTSVGSLLAGSNWDQARELALPTGLWVLGMALGQGPRIGLRALSLGRRTLHLSVVIGILLLIGTSVGAAWAGGAGAAWGFGIVSMVTAIAWWVAFLRAVRAPGAAGA